MYLLNTSINIKEIKYPFVTFSLIKTDNSFCKALQANVISSAVRNAMKSFIRFCRTYILSYPNACFICHKNADFAHKMVHTTYRMKDVCIITKAGVWHSLWLKGVHYCCLKIWHPCGILPMLLLFLFDFLQFMWQALKTIS